MNFIGKCLCANSKSIYGFNCLSLQFYEKKRNCILNKKSLEIQPNDFRPNFRPDSKNGETSDFLANRCESESPETRKYLKDFCSK